jgi:lipopolysaccharide export LptBFGC system permease protein LptF
MGTQQLSKGSELVAAQGLGTGTGVFVRPWLWLALLLVGLAGLNAHYVIPRVQGLQLGLRDQLAEEAKQRFLRPGVAPLPIPGPVPQALWTSPEGQVHILEVNPRGVQHLVSDRVNWRWDPAEGERSLLSLRLQDVTGSHLPRDGSGSAQLRQAFQTISFPIKIATKNRTSTQFRGESTASLWALSQPEAQAELARRLTLPLLSAGLLLVGIALGYGHPRLQRSGGLLGGLGVMVGYYVSYRTLESRLGPEHPWMLGVLVLLPVALTLFGGVLLALRMRPHRSWGGRLVAGASRLFRAAIEALPGRAVPGTAPAPRTGGHTRERGDFLGRWSRGLWLRAWGGVVTSLLFLHLLIEYSSRGGDFTAAGRPPLDFLVYWAWRVPEFLTTALPVAFMVGTVLALSNATLSLEWVALRTGGVSLWQWIWSARGAWLGVLAGTFAIYHLALPLGEARVRKIRQGLLRAEAPGRLEARWQYLGSTGVLWYIEPEVRWGFPLKRPGEAPALLVWRPGEAHSRGLPWGDFALRQGPEARHLFPDASLLGTPIAEENSTPALLRWQRWAYEPGRATHLWTRFLGWLAGPCLVFAVLARAFPDPRSGRSGALGRALVAGLLFLGVQMLFNGAAQAGEIPAAWGILGPLLLAVGAGAAQLRHLRT